MPKYKPIYKCRLCGAVFEGKKAADAALTDYMYASIPVLHNCGGQVGLADLQGWKPLPDPTAEDKTESGLLEEG